MARAAQLAQSLVGQTRRKLGSARCPASDDRAGLRRGNGAGADERIEHDARSCGGVAAAAGTQFSSDGQMTERLVRLSCPGPAAACADLLRAGRQQGTLDELLGKDRVVGAAIAGGGQRARHRRGSCPADDRPVPAPSSGRGRCGCRSSGPRQPSGTDHAEAALGRPAQPARVRNADGVEVEEVAALADEEVDDLVSAAEAVADARRHRVGLCPDDLVAQYPAVLRSAPGRAAREPARDSSRGPLG